MILGLGADLIEVSRVKNAIERHSQKFLEKIFSKNEILYCTSHKNEEIYFAGRFAAKEAVSKALGTGFGKELSFLDIEITHDPKGKPEVLLSQKALLHWNAPKILISISHTKTHAFATAIWTIHK